MPFGSNTHKLRLAVATLLLLLPPLTVLATVSEEQLTVAKDQFTELWHSAAETTKRRATLEENLAQFDQKVAHAKVSMAKAASDRKDVRERIMAKKALIALLTQQADAVRSSQDFYRSVALTQQQDYKAFIRYLVSKDIATSESGPAGGGLLLKQIFKGSLGDSVDDALAHQAIIRARGRFLSQVHVLLGESTHAAARLQEVTSNMNAELRDLERQSTSLGAKVDEVSAQIDDSWRQKKLDEEELKTVAQDTAEANARIGSMQASLVQINTELKESKVKHLKDELAVIQKNQETLTEQREALKRKDEAMHSIEDAALKALQVTVQERNTDKKLYKHIEDVQFDLKRLTAERSALTDSGADIKIAADLDVSIAIINEQLDMMKQGVPADSAKDYVQKKRQASQASDARKDIAMQIDQMGPAIGKLAVSLNAKLVEIETAENSSNLEGLPPIFTWPVNGHVTAGYYDADYQTVFGVPHRAIDIAVPQNTQVRTVSEGVVFAVKDGGATGYSYILIGHSNGYASLYGHVSSSFVKAGDIVGFGQVIGLSGGAPGSHGAGHMTTGSHLHLEMMKDGEHFNPLTILPGR